jgi:hypothetical protein
VYHTLKIYENSYLVLRLATSKSLSPEQLFDWSIDTGFLEVECLIFENSQKSDGPSQVSKENAEMKRNLRDVFSFP